MEMVPHADSLWKPAMETVLKLTLCRTELCPVEDVRVVPLSRTFSFLRAEHVPRSRA